MTEIAGDLMCTCGMALVPYENRKGHYCANCDRLQPQETIVVNAYQDHSGNRIEEQGARVETKWDERFKMVMTNKQLGWYGDEIETTVKELGHDFP